MKLLKPTAFLLPLIFAATGLTAQDAPPPEDRLEEAAAVAAAPEDEEIETRVVSTSDGATTMPAPVKAPGWDSLHDLMEDMADSHKKILDPQPEVAARAARDVGRHAVAAAWEPLREEETDGYLKLLADLWKANAELQKALEEEAPRADIMRAFQKQNRTCNACHKVYRE